jgi:hypothetical protein
LVTLAIKVVLVPSQIVVPGFVLMLIVGVTTGFTVIVILLLVAVTGVAQLALLVITQLTTLPLVNVAVL